MTKREKQLLDWIIENPTISQQELADRAGITRSSVAVHISNLMKKGYLKGKGYIIGTPDYSLVVGGINKDIGGIPFSKLVPRDSNPGQVTTSIGGVGRNIAHNMALLGISVKMISAIGEDDFTPVIQKSCRDLGIDISHTLRVPKMRNATYLFIVDEDGDMELALSDMEIYNYVTPKYLNEKKDLLQRAKVVVADTNIPEVSLRYLGDTLGETPLFVDPVSTIKAEKIVNMLDKIHTLKPNKLEAEFLSGVKIVDDKTLKVAGLTLIGKGVKRVFISLGEEGVFAIDEHEHFKMPCNPANLVNATGAGDAFMAALVKAYMDGLDLRSSCRLATSAASIAVESLETINPSMCYEEVIKRM